MKEPITITLDDFNLVSGSTITTIASETVIIKMDKDKQKELAMKLLWDLL